MSLRRKIADSPWLNSFVHRVFATWIRLTHKSIRWDRIGYEPMEEALRAGDQIILVFWHQRLFMAPYLFPQSLGRICSLTSAGRAGQLVGGLLKHFGVLNVSMSSHKRHIALSRQVLRNIQDGYSVGIAADGPRGPERVMSEVPLVWARISGKRVFACSYSARRVLEVSSWDRFWIPAPFTRGVFVCQEWSEPVPKKLDQDQVEALRLSLEARLDEVTDASDRAAGRQIPA